jgi:hypothetical protein
VGKLKIHSFLFCLIFCLSFLSVGFSETVTLKSGQKVEGRIIEKTDQYVKLEFQGVQLVYYNDEIVSIDQVSSDSANTVTESLYKAYISSLNAPQQSKDEKAEEFLPSAKPEPNEATQASPASQVIPEITPPLDLSRMPPEYQKLIKTTLSNLKPSKSKPVEEKK